MNITKFVINCCLAAICMTNVLMHSSAYGQTNEAERKCAEIAKRISKNETISKTQRDELLQVIARDCLKEFQPEKNPPNPPWQNFR
jgi:hypothetical protein